jgi:hypothetical protein
MRSHRVDHTAHFRCDLSQAKPPLFQYFDFHIRFVTDHQGSGKALIVLARCISFQSACCIKLHPAVTPGRLAALLLLAGGEPARRIALPDNPADPDSDAFNRGFKVCAGKDRQGVDGESPLQ